jgi:hypothetical protein
VQLRVRVARGEVPGLEQAHQLAADIYQLVPETAALLEVARALGLRARQEPERALAVVEAIRTALQGLPLFPNARTELDAEWIACLRATGRELPAEAVQQAADRVRAVADDLSADFPETARAWLEWPPAATVLEAEHQDAAMSQAR